MLLPKGFEVEIYTGTPQGEVVGFADRIVRDLHGFVIEPDNRNVEYTTAPLYDYDRLLCALVRPRLKLRSYLQQWGDYTLLPGSTLALGGSDRFYRTDPGNPYHDFIERAYGTRVVTASVHINVGFDDPETLMQACRLVQVEAPLYLALSASSPFLDGQASGQHSTRWGMFPRTPSRVPLFESHWHHIRWMEEQLASGTIQNVRHLWASVRPNGDRRPYNLNRLELRICDLIADPVILLAVTALLEARLTQMLRDPSLDPLEISTLPAGTRAQDLLDLTDANETAAARSSLDAQLRHWQDGRPVRARDWIAQLYQQVQPIAQQQGFSCFLSPIQTLLRDGNTAQQWLQQYERGRPIRSILQAAIAGTERGDRELEERLCQLLAA